MASSRAVLRDPARPLLPKGVQIKARELLLGVRGRASRWESMVATDEGLRQVLIKFIADFANWDKAAITEYLETGRGLEIWPESGFIRASSYT